ncbi:MAG: hypothetical protein WCO25_03610 [Candidatus Uhrbacteria bacterium]
MQIRRSALSLASHPGKILLWPLVRWYQNRYEGRYRFARLAFSFDLVLIGLAAALGIVALVLFLYKPVPFADKIVFAAEVAPREIVSGTSSTLVIRYENGTGEELRDANLVFEFPAHFLLQSVDDKSLADDAGVGSKVVVGTIPVGGTGSVKIRGVMFGPIGGEQTFRSVMTFVHGAKSVAGQKADAQTFSPSKSTLQLTLSLPEKILAFQPMNGMLTYKNTGAIDYPEVTVAPEWPAGFTFVSADEPMRDGLFVIPALTAGAEGTTRFVGNVGNATEPLAFQFRPSFAFGTDSYELETLTQAAEVVPLPIRITHSVENDTVRPGGSANVTVTYENIGDVAVQDLRIFVSSNSPFATMKTVEANFKQSHPELAKVEPGQTGTITLSIPLKTSVEQSATRVYENLPFATTASATFDMAELSQATVADSPITTVMTSPLVLSSFGRYATPSGDQIGRGPLPPTVDEETSYWIFWNIRGTTNALRNVRIEGQLGENVAFTGRQTDSVNGGVLETGSQIVWTADSLSPTLSPDSKIVGVAFEVSLMPTADQIGTAPTLLRNIRVTATDAVTGAVVSAAGTAITTSLPDDAMAGGMAIVE